MGKILKVLFKLVIRFAFVMPTVGMSTNYVTICAADGSFKVGDQFGGQLLHVFSVLAFAWDNGLVPYFSRELLQNAKGASINYPLFFYRLNQDLPFDADKSDLIHIRERCPYAPLGKSEMNKVQYAPYAGRNVCMCLAGVYPYFHHRDRLRAFFSPSRSIKIYLNRKYKHIIEHRKTIAVHVRTFHPTLTLPLFLGAEYYKTAMGRFSDDHLFVVFSDRIEWAKQNLEGTKPNMIFIKEENHILEFYLMTFCLNHIISNSNFSHLAAFLKKDPSGLTLVPEICHSDGRPKDYEDWYFPGCITLPVTPLSFPNWDLLNYPTTSIDEGGRPY